MFWKKNYYEWVTIDNVLIRMVKCTRVLWINLWFNKFKIVVYFVFEFQVNLYIVYACLAYTWPSNNDILIMTLSTIVCAHTAPDFTSWHWRMDSKRYLHDSERIFMVYVNVLWYKYMIKKDACHFCFMLVYYNLNTWYHDMIASLYIKTHLRHINFKFVCFDFVWWITWIFN